MSGLASGSSTKKRKKPENKPQSQINKCLNEKRRREQENIYIEELAELISASFTDMSSLSVKPDKCAILQETVLQIKTIKGGGATSDAVQQGEVSSSKPTILTNEVFGPLLLEALEGFLFVVNPEGKVEFCTENITQFIKYRREEVLGQPVYNIIHHGDHARFSSWLLPMSWSNDYHPPRPRTFNCRFLIKPPPDTTVEEKQQRPSKYENMQISSTQLPQSSGVDKDDDGSSESGPCLMCVARRIPPNEKPTGTPIEQFTMKLNTNGRIINVDNTGVSAPYSQYFSKDLMHRNLDELVQSSDVPKVVGNIKDALTTGHSCTSTYKLQIGHDKFVNVQTKFKLFKSANRQIENDFIMATHSIFADNETNPEVGSPVSNNTNQMGSSNNNNNNNNNNQLQQHQQQPQQQQSSSTGGVGGPLIASVNGANNRDLSNTITLNNSSAFHSVTLNSSDIDFNFPDIFPSSSTWDLSSDERGWERPESRQSLTPVESPLYSSQPIQSPATTPFSTPYAFSPIQEAAQEEPQEEDSGRLRNLLMTKRPSTESEDGGGGALVQRNRHRILKNLLNQEDEESPPQDSKPPNNMLLKLLNTQSDDDDVEARAGLKKQNELLHQLLKEEDNQENQQSGDDGLLKSLGFRGEGSEESRGGRKRPSSDENEDQPGSKRSASSLLDAVPPPPIPSVPSAASGKSRLWEKNQMLASLLAKRPTTPASIPPIPASVISATPQDKLQRLVKHPQTGWSGGSVQAGAGSPGQGRSGRSPGYTGPHTWDSASSDPVLSDILDQVIEIVPDVNTDAPALMNMINSLEAETQQSVQQQFASQQEFLNEKMAINAIQKSLMLCESAVKSPTYQPSMSQGSPQSQPQQQPQPQPQQQPQQQFHPPPMYQQRQRFPIQQQQQIRQQFSINPQLLMAQRNKIQHQQMQQKQRLLQLQQQQQLVIPSNATASNADPALHNIDSLINNTVAPNVSLQRSSSVPDSQLSPVGSYPGLGSVPSPGQRRPFSPVNGGMTSFSNAGGAGPPGSGSGPQARLSPSSMQGYQQQPQLSPRLPQGQQGYGGGGANWSQQNSRLSLQQQENPVLNAQLTSGGRGYARATTAGLPSVRSLAGPQRFPTAADQQAGAASYQFRLQRQVSAPPPQQSSPNPQLPGGTRVGYGGGLGSPPLCHHPPGAYQDQAYCYQEQAYPSRLLLHSHGGNNGVTEYVRQELRAIVGARTSGSGRPQVPGSLPLPTPAVDLDSLPYDIQPQGVNDSPKMWGGMNEMGTSSPQPTQQLSSRSTMEEVPRSNDQKSSLLQKLLSE